MSSHSNAKECFGQKLRKGACFVLFCGFLPLATASLSQAQLLPVGARSLALGGVSIALQHDPEAIFHNPASLADLSAVQVALFYQRPFGIRELSLATGSIAIPLQPVRLGVGLYTFGNPLFRQQAVLLGAATPLPWGISTAVSIRYQRTDIEGYGSRGRLGLDIAMLARPTDELDWGFSLRQLNQEDATRGGITPVAEIAVGLGYRPSEDLYLIAEVFDEPQFEPDFRFGVELRVANLLTLRAGGGLSPGRFSAGFGLRKLGIGFDYAFFTHGDLGLTHQFGVVFAAGGRRESPAENAAKERAQPPVSVELNTATEEELRTLPGIGPTLAGRIVAYRIENGPFQELEELLNVPGIGKETLKRLRPFLRLDTTVRP
jgi:competence ComEA-like helix-hairpin-helix protein